MLKMEPAKASESKSEDEGAEPKKFDKYEVESAADTIMRAHEHMANPALMKHVQKHLDKKAKAIRSIADLKSRRSEMESGGA